MRAAIIPFAAVALVMGTAACAPMAGDAPAGTRAEAAPRACFLTQTVTNFRNDRSTTLYVKAGRNDVYRISTGGCPDLESAVSLAITPSTGIGGSQICVGDLVDLNASGGSQRMGPCRASVDAKLTEAEIAALPGRLRP